MFVPYHRWMTMWFSLRNIKSRGRINPCFAVLCHERDIFGEDPGQQGGRAGAMVFWRI